MVKIIISGGGTGGHIFPAIAIANELKERLGNNCELLFVGAKDRMEMEKVPAAGYKIVGLPIYGLDRKNIFKNIRVVWQLIKSLFLARSIIKQFKPDVAIGVGGYASAPTLWIASLLGVPTLIQEQNSFAGVTNKLLKSSVSKICVAYDGMERFFPKEKLMITGNPVRKDLILQHSSRSEAASFFGLKSDRPTLLILGGSLGALSINKAVIQNLYNLLTDPSMQVIWQTGKNYYPTAQKAFLKQKTQQSNLWCADFISRMDYAYTLADVVISRAGASSISELCLLGKPSILVPSPNVAEDHQTHNAMALVSKEAAILVRDCDASIQLIDEAKKLLCDDSRKQILEKNIKRLAKPNSATIIAEEVVKLITN